MRIIITGTPGTGKTTAGKALARRLKGKYVNEHSFCLRHGIGKIDGKSRELVVDAKQLEKALKKSLAKEKNFVLEGHLVCETKVPADLIVVLSCGPKELEKRLGKKGYSDEKALDNLHCESTQYCLKKATANYGKRLVLRADNSKGIKKTLALIIKAIKPKSFD